ncbi:MAG: ATP-binding protein [Prevotellaceae bacterium]|jgi:hypothetical protein|nr:ATP-binding protein [Prevotellaceae bacterium]
MSDIRKLPVGIQDFEDLRAGNYVYVDKTRYLHRLVKMGNPFFMGRPQRFGKSLLLSTMKAYFEGKKHLFEGLAIAELEKEWTKHPVIYIDLNQADYRNKKDLHDALNSILGEYEEKWNVKSKEGEYSLRFKNIITSAYDRTGQRVAVLVDGYDKPMTDTMGDSEAYKDIHIFLCGFYGLLKSMGGYLCFEYLTGVTKFTNHDIFSGLNHLNDVSTYDRFSGICGITEQELLDNFKPEIELLAKRKELTAEQALAEMKKRYGGYLFAEEGENVYNPFSVLSAFSECNFGSYWIETETLDVLARQVERSGMDIMKLDGDTMISRDQLRNYRPGVTSLVPLLFQSGYLTIKSSYRRLEAYILGFPNEEVKYGFLERLLPAYLPKWNTNETFSMTAFAEEVLAGNAENFMTMLRACIVSVSCDFPETENGNERYCQKIFYIIFSLAGQFIDMEVKSSDWFADVVKTEVKTENAIYVFGFKTDDKAAAEDALAQIESKGHSVPDTADHRRRIKIGVEFSVKEGGIKRWLVVSG